MSINCPVCESSETRVFLAQKNVPVHQNLVFKNKNDAINITRGDLEMRVCSTCGFVFNAAFEEEKTSYDEHYDNTQCHSAHFVAHLDQMAGRIVASEPKGDAVIVEVGCGKGDFLKRMIDRPGTHYQGYGFDPTYVGPDEERGGRIKFQKTFYDGNAPQIPADIVICRHVIEHIAQPKILMQAVADGLGPGSHAKVFFETPDVTWIFKHQVIWDFFYEHCSIFTPASIAYAFRKSGFAVTDVRTVFDGQYLWAEATPDSSAAAGARDEIPDLSDYLALAQNYQDSYEAQKAEATILLKSLKSSGAVALWGAGAKGMSLANLLDPHVEIIDVIIDINPNKQGGFIAGTGHEIIGVQDIQARGITSAVIMNPNYHDEIAADLRARDIDIHLVNWDK